MSEEEGGLDFDFLLDYMQLKMDMAVLLLNDPNLVEHRSSSEFASIINEFLFFLEDPLFRDVPIDVMFSKQTQCRISLMQWSIRLIWQLPALTHCPGPGQDGGAGEDGADVRRHETMAEAAAEEAGESFGDSDSQ